MAKKLDKRKKLQLYNIFLCAIVGYIVNNLCNLNILLSIILIVLVLLFLFKVVKIEKYIKKYLIK